VSSWSSKKDSEQKAVAKYAPKNLTDPSDYQNELREIESNQALSVLDKYKAKKQLMNAVMQAKQQEINHHLDSYENYLLARKDVEARSISLEAQKAIMRLETEQLQMMKDLGLSHAQELADTLIEADKMLTRKLREIEESDINPEIKTSTLKNVMHVWEKTRNRILESVDTYIDELYEREKNR